MTPLQLELPIVESNPQVFSLTGIVREVLLAHDWITPYQLQAEVEALTGKWHSDASISARLRELRRKEYGSYIIERRKKIGTRSFEYALTGRKDDDA